MPSTHTYHIKGNAPVINNFLEVKYPLHIFVTYVQAVTQQNEPRTVQNATL